MGKPKIIPVVAAVIERNGRYLVAQRPNDKHLALKWEFPGGKVESGEAAADALVREIREELGCEIRILQALPHYVHHYETVSIRLIPFLARIQEGATEPHPHEHVTIKWLPLSDLEHIDLAEADWGIVDTLSAG